MTEQPGSQDPTVSAPVVEQADTDTAETKPRQEKDWEAEAAKWKTLARKHEQRTKELAPAAQRLQELEDAQKSELEKLQGTYEQALGEASRAQHELWRERAARRHGLDDELLGFLTGESEEELDTRRRCSRRSSPPAPKRRNRSLVRPRPHPRPGRGHWRFDR